MVEIEPLPSSFNLTVEARGGTSNALAELHHYRWDTPEYQRFQLKSTRIDMVLSHRPPGARGRFLRAGAKLPATMGPTIFLPAHHELECEWLPGEQTSICCTVDDKLADFSADTFDWNSSRMAAALDLRSEFIRVCMGRIAQEIISPGFSRDLMIETICQAILIDLKSYIQTVSDATPSSHRLSPLHLGRIDAMLDVEGPAPCIGDFAAACGLSNRHFSRLFQQATGKTIGTYAAERKIERAKSLLASRQDRMIKEIAWMCGFENSAAFSVAFRRVTGMSPREYRDIVPRI